MLLKVDTQEVHRVKAPRYLNLTSSQAGLAEDGSAKVLDFIIAGSELVHRVKLHQDRKKSPPDEEEGVEGGSAVEQSCSICTWEL